MTSCCPQAIDNNNRSNEWMEILAFNTEYDHALHVLVLLSCSFKVLHVLLVHHRG